MLRDPDRLQSEGFVTRQHEFLLLARKALPPVLARPDLPEAGMKEDGPQERIFNKDDVPLQAMIKVSDAMREIEDWHIVFQNAICVAPDADAKALARRSNSLLPGIRYLI